MVRLPPCGNSDSSGERLPSVPKRDSRQAAQRFRNEVYPADVSPRRVVGVGRDAPPRHSAGGCDPDVADIGRILRPGALLVSGHMKLHAIGAFDLRIRNIGHALLTDV